MAEGSHTFGLRRYELTNHLGNVLTVISDKVGMKADSVWATVLSASDYYPFGLEMKGRTWTDSTYRYGFNGKEKDASFGGSAVYDYGYRIYNPEIGKFLSVDPLTKSYPWYTPYQFAGNKPIAAIDLDGLEEVIRINYMNTNGKLGKTSVLLINSNDLRSEAATIWKELNNSLAGKQSKFGSDIYFEGYEDYAKGSHTKGGQNIAPLRGELTITKDGDKFTYFGYNKEITKDAIYQSAVIDHRFGAAYDLAEGTQDLGKKTALAGLGVTATVVGAEIGVPMMKVGNGLSLGGDILEVGIDLLHGDGKEALITVLSNAPDYFFKKLGGKTKLGKDNPSALEATATIIGLGSNQIAEKATEGQKKPSAEQIKKSNESELKSIGN